MQGLHWNRPFSSSHMNSLDEVLDADITSRLENIASTCVFAPSIPQHEIRSCPAQKASKNIRWAVRV